MDVAVIVKAHPARRHLRARLLDGFAGLEVHVVEDPEPDDPVRSCWRTMAACLDHVDDLPAATSHVVVVEDDVEACAGFPARLGRILEQRPDDPVALWVSLRHGQAAVEVDDTELGHFDRRRARALAAGAAGDELWLRLRTYVLPVVAVAFPVEQALELRDWAARNPPVLGGMDDNLAVTGWVAATGRRMLAPCLSPLEHPDREPSLLVPGHRGRGRTAYLYKPRW